MALSPYVTGLKNIISAEVMAETAVASAAVLAARDDAITDISAAETAATDAITTARDETLADVSAIYAGGALTVEAAYAIALDSGKQRVVVTSPWTLSGNFTATLPIEFLRGSSVSCGAFTLNLSGGFVAGDYQQVFTPADASKITLPAWQRLTPFHFGAKADFVSSGSPGTDDADALNAWAQQLCWRVMPRGNYGVTKTIFWNGMEVGVSANDANGIKAEPGAGIYQRTDNIPIFVFYGARGQWRFPRLEYVNAQPTTNYSAVAALCSSYPGQGAGFYRNSISMLNTQFATLGVFFPASFSSTLSSSATVGANSVVVTHGRAEHNTSNGSRTWVAGLYIQIELDDGSFHITKITSSDANTPCTLGIADPLPSAAASGNLIAHASNALASPSDALSAPTRASNNWDNVLIEYCSRYGWCCNSNGTQDVFLNRYIDGGTIGNTDVTVWSAKLVSAIHEGARQGDHHVVTNIEHFEHSSDAWRIGVSTLSGEPCSIDAVHYEGCRAGAGGVGLLGGHVRSIDIGTIHVTYCTILDTASDGVTAVASAGIFAPRAISSTTTISGDRGVWRCRLLHTTKNIIKPGTGYLVRDNSSNTTRVEIETWNYERDGGLYPTSNLVSSASGATPWNFAASATLGTPIKIGNIFPGNVVAFRLDADISVTTVQDMYGSNKGSYKVKDIVYRNASKVPTTATAGVFNESGAANLVSAVNNTALSGLTSKTGDALYPGINALEASKARSAGTRLFFKCAASESAPSAVTGASSYLTGRNGGLNNTNLGFINFGSAHGFTVGNVVVVSGSVNSALNSTFKIVDVPTTTQIVVYCDSANAVGSAGSPIADAAISVQLRPTIDVFALGDDWGIAS